MEGGLRVKKSIIIIIFIFLLFFLAVTLPKAIDFSEKVDYCSLNGYSLPTKDGYYYLPSENFSTIRSERTFDNKGVVVYDYGGTIGKQYNPVTISQYVLSIAPYAYTNEEAYDSMRINLEFLLLNANITPKGNIIHPYNFDWPTNNESAPWYSSMAQGQAASAFLWGYRISNETRFYEGAKKSILALIEENSSVPFIKQKNGGKWLKEYPHYKYEVLDGSLAAIAGVYDLYRSLDESDPDKYLVESLLKDSIDGFKKSSHEFRSTFFGHYFDNSKIVPNPSYYSCNLAWLKYLSNYDPELEIIREGYIMKNCNLFKEIFIWYWNTTIYYIFHKTIL
ncbi:MAG: D-glucuronyl C5-epimerase family protein [Methanolinea sp.]|nr:D-glucuronyl C5-epimerase family protein [Methanolinea sp.]